MLHAYETSKGLVTISEQYITVDNKVYNICSEQLSCGEYDTYTLQEIDKYLVLDPETNITYIFTLSYDQDIELKYLEEVLHEKVYYYICELIQSK